MIRRGVYPQDGGWNGWLQRAQILLRYHAGETVSQIARALRITRKSVAPVDR